MQTKHWQWKQEPGTGRTESHPIKAISCSLWHEICLLQLLECEATLIAKLQFKPNVFLEIINDIEKSQF